MPLAEDSMNVIIYGDFNCPYCYLASQRADKLIRGGLARVGWRAVEHDRRLAVTGTPSQASRSAWDKELAEVASLALPGEHAPAAPPPVISNTGAAVAAYAEAVSDGIADELRRRLFAAIWVQGRHISSTHEVRRLVTGLMWPPENIRDRLASPDIPSLLNREPDPARIVRRSGGTIEPDGVPLTTAGWRRIRQWRQDWLALPSQVIPAVIGPGGALRSGVDGLRHLAGLAGAAGVPPRLPAHAETTPGPAPPAPGGVTGRGSGMGARRPRAAWHTAAGTVVAAYLLAAAVVVAAHRVVPVPRWLALHLLVLGAATNAVFVWSRFFAETLLHARPGSARPAAARLVLLNAGVAAVLAGVAGGLVPLAVAGAALVAGAVIAHVASLLAMVSSSRLAGPLAVVAWYYVAAGAALAVGGTLGGVLAAGPARSPALDDALVLAHAQANLLGWLGLAIIGTQFMLWPMVLRTRMSQDAPRAARRVLAAAGGGLAVTVAALLASPYLGGARWLAAAGMAAYLAGAVLSLAPAAREMRAKPPRTAAAWALLAANAWLIIALAADTASLAAGLHGADQMLDRLLVPVLGVGMVAQVLAGALTFLLPVTVGGGPAGNRRLTAILERGWRTRAVLGNAGVAALAGLAGGGWPRAVAWAAVLAGFGTFPVLAGAALVAGHARKPGRGPPAVRRRRPARFARGQRASRGHRPAGLH
jgi:2-hydroxychromene-2-carboxylate isomerase